MLAEKDIEVYALYPNSYPDLKLHAYPRSAEITSKVFPQRDPNGTYKDIFVNWVTIENFVAFGDEDYSIYAAYIPKGTEYTQTDSGLFLTEKLDYKVHILGHIKF